MLLGIFGEYVLGIILDLWILQGALWKSLPSVKNFFLLRVLCTIEKSFLNLCCLAMGNDDIYYIMELSFLCPDSSLTHQPDCVPFLKVRARDWNKTRELEPLFLLISRLRAFPLCQY